jgi:hypothetical protein
MIRAGPPVREIRFEQRFQAAPKDIASSFLQSAARTIGQKELIEVAATSRASSSITWV